ncbi:MAG: hypothetical protein AAF587_20385 [Bacteroidota bacterium]
MDGKTYDQLKAHYDKQRFRNPRDRRLAKEHLALAQLCEQTNRITYSIDKPGKLPPENYIIGYHVKSIVGIDEQQNPVYESYHEVKVSFPAGFPTTAAAKIYMHTPAWHPNIKWKGNFKGRICGNTSEFGKLFLLNMLALRIGEILQYKNYHAEQVPPFPEDEEVARWIREFAEPNDIVNKEKGIVVDDSSLFEEQEASEAEIITAEVVPTEEVPPVVEAKIEETPPPPPPADKEEGESRPKITIKKPRDTKSSKPSGLGGSIKINRR